MEEKKIPKCVGLIIDGNRRWAREHGLPTFEGHRKGYEKLKDAVKWAKEAGVKHMVVYTFSSQNWSRAEKEVSYLMNLIKRLLVEDAEEFKKEEVRLRVIGDKERPAKDIIDAAKKLEEETKHFTACTLALAFSYGGREEITNAVNRIVAEKEMFADRAITEQDIAEHLWTSGIPDPDLIIRTSGERRLSNFLPWQSVYSELFFVQKHWPAFTKEDFFEILDEFAGRERRYGK
jgi:undecaprenyl diphosphate synthase